MLRTESLKPAPIPSVQWPLQRGLLFIKSHTRSRTQALGWHQGLQNQLCFPFGLALLQYRMSHWWCLHNPVNSSESLVQYFPPLMSWEEDTAQSSDKVDTQMSSRQQLSTDRETNVQAKFTLWTAGGCKDRWWPQTQELRSWVSTCRQA